MNLGNYQMMTELLEMNKNAVGKQVWNPKEHPHLRDRQRRKSLHRSPRRVLSRGELGS